MNTQAHVFAIVSAVLFGLELSCGAAFAAASDVSLVGSWQGNFSCANRNQRITVAVVALSGRDQVIVALQNKTGNQRTVWTSIYDISGGSFSAGQLSHEIKPHWIAGRQTGTYPFVLRNGKDNRHIRADYFGCRHIELEHVPAGRTAARSKSYLGIWFSPFNGCGFGDIKGKLAIFATGSDDFYLDGQFTVLTSRIRGLAGLERRVVYWGTRNPSSGAIVFQAVARMPTLRNGSQAQQLTLGLGFRNALIGPTTGGGTLPIRMNICRPTVLSRNESTVAAQPASNARTAPPLQAAGRRSELARKLPSRRNGPMASRQTPPHRAAAQSRARANVSPPASVGASEDAGAPTVGRLHIQGAVLGMTEAEVMRAMTERGFQPLRPNNAQVFRRPGSRQPDISVSYLTEDGVKRARSITQVIRQRNGAALKTGQLLKRLEQKFGKAQCSATGLEPGGSCTWIRPWRDGADKLEWQVGNNAIVLGLIPSARPSIPPPPLASQTSNKPPNGSAASSLSSGQARPAADAAKNSRYTAVSTIAATPAAAKGGASDQPAAQANTGTRATKTISFEIEGARLGMTLVQATQALKDRGFKADSPEGKYFSKPPELGVEITIGYRKGGYVHSISRELTDVYGKKAKGNKLLTRYMRLRNWYATTNCSSDDLGGWTCTWTQLREGRQETLRWRETPGGPDWLALFESVAPPTAATVARITTPEEMYQLAVKLDKGENYTEAAKWYRKAAKQGYTPAQYNLGHMYFYGQGVPQNPGLANRWFREAAKHGDAKSMLALGIMWATGEGMGGWIDFSKATAYLSDAKRRGNPGVAHVADDVLAQIALARKRRREAARAASEPPAPIDDQWGEDIWLHIK